ncbi:hypothetical protein D8M04_05990 [Oceanobacillus piezotolerans]|uniref:YtxH domain-containing protein n=1 Tax=Oceanobacillus piezotolerans TaxID=2448030 RepID=A0A498DJU8_9BACI|nr:hypothetical protein [Oceanobacillus piezotolerans]RLL46752.1 hypothetical protein D8M04_05990 [Oceanobacillus piezotolerans]
MNTTVSNQKKAKTGLVVAGVLATGASIVLLNPNVRSKVKDTSRNVKDSVNQYATTIKEDPNGTKQAIITRIQNATEISKEALNKIQSILDNQAKDIKETTQSVVGDAKEVVDTAKDAQGELKDVKDKAVEAKDELVSAKDEVKSNKNEKNSKQQSNTTTSNKVEKTPVRHN